MRVAGGHWSGPALPRSQPRCTRLIPISLVLVLLVLVVDLVLLLVLVVELVLTLLDGTP